MHLNLKKYVEELVDTDESDAMSISDYSEDEFKSPVESRPNIWSVTQNYEPLYKNRTGITEDFLEKLIMLI